MRKKFFMALSVIGFIGSTFSTLNTYKAQEFDTPVIFIWGGLALAFIYWFVKLWIEGRPIKLKPEDITIEEGPPSESVNPNNLQELIEKDEGGPEDH